MLHVQFDLSIIIPTFQRPQILRKCLDCITAQTCRDLEVIVVSDGPDEKTAEMMVSLEWPFELQYFAVPKSQQGVCRNRGFDKARGEYVMFIGDDIFLAPDACERHLKAHSGQKIPSTTSLRRSGIANLSQAFLYHVGDPATRLRAEAATAAQARRREFQKNSKSQIPNVGSGFLVLGHTIWHPSLKITPLMKWMEKSGVQFGYPKIEKYRHNFLPEEIQHFYTYTSHISLPSKIFHRHRFREDVTLYGWEDVEWGNRLAESGISLFYEPAAKAYHHHEFTDEEVWERSRLLGESAVKMEKLVLGMKIIPRGFKKLTYQIFSFLPTYRGRHCKNFLNGMKVSSD